MVLRLEASEGIAAVAEETRGQAQTAYEWRDAYRAMGVAGLAASADPKPGWKGRHQRRREPRGVPRLQTSNRPRSAPRAGFAKDETEEGRGADRRAAAVIGRQQADTAFTSRALRLWDATTERLACHLYAVINVDRCWNPQGFSQDDANVQRLCGLGGVSLRRRILSPFRPACADARGQRTCAI